MIYHLPIPLGYKSMGIVHLEIINILVATKLFKNVWSGYKILVQCDNEAVVSVLQTGRTQDPFLGACARNIWYLAALENIHLQYVHIPGKRNITADLLSRWTGFTKDVQMINHLRVTLRFIGSYIIGGKQVVYKDHFEIENRKGNSVFPPTIP